jgi:hypothetical protein
VLTLVFYATTVYATSAYPTAAMVDA